MGSCLPRTGPGTAVWPCIGRLKGVGSPQVRAVGELGGIEEVVLIGVFTGICVLAWGEDKLIGRL